MKSKILWLNTIKALLRFAPKKSVTVIIRESVWIKGGRKMNSKKIADLCWLYLTLEKDQQFLLWILMKYRIEYDDFIQLVNLARTGKMD